MITLKQAVNILSLKDSDIVYICKKHCEPFAKSYSIKEIRNKFDMKNIMVKKIYTYHFLFSEDLCWEFII